MKDITQFITENYLIIVPALYVMGMIIKNTEKVKDKYIPLILLVCGVALALLMGGLSVASAVQGVLVTGVAVFTNQLVKQNRKD